MWYRAEQAVQDDSAEQAVLAFLSGARDGSGAELMNPPGTASSSRRVGFRALTTEVTSRHGLYIQSKEVLSDRSTRLRI